MCPWKRDMGVHWDSCIVRSLTGAVRGASRPLRNHPFCQFVLFKENKSTMDAVGLLQKFLGIRDKHCLDFAGNKDTRAVTCQFVTAHKVCACLLD